MCVEGCMCVGEVCVCVCVYGGPGARVTHCTFGQFGAVQFIAFSLEMTAMASRRQWCRVLLISQVLLFMHLG